MEDGDFRKRVKKGRCVVVSCRWKARYYRRHASSLLPEAGHSDLDVELLVRLTDVKHANIDERQPVRLVGFESDHCLGPVVSAELRQK